MYINKVKGARILHCSTNSIIHIGHQPNPTSPYVGEHGLIVKMSIRTSKLIVGEPLKDCASDVSKNKVDTIGGGGLTDAKWMDDKRGAELACLKLKIDKCEGNECNPKVDHGH